MEIQPITVFHDGSRSFGRYLHEILLAEGFPYSVEVDLADVEGFSPTESPVVLFAEMPISSKRAEAILEMADRGAVVFLMRPGAVLLEELDIVRGGVLYDGYASWEGHAGVRIHGDADVYEPVPGARILASLRKTRDGPDLAPGYLVAKRGKGAVAIFSFNLPQSVVLTRQGNPAWSDSKGDDHEGIRPNDLFYRPSGQTWMDPGNAQIPRADLLQRFLAGQLISLCPIPLPRTWYFPNMGKASFTVVADSDGASSREVESEAALLQEHGGVFSTYLIDRTLDSITGEEIDRLVSSGHEVSIHPHCQVGAPVKIGMPRAYESMIYRFLEKAGFSPCTVRHHRLAWTGWMDIPRMQEGFGIRLDNNYGYPPWFGQERYGVGPVGFITGSGQPQRFCDGEGNLLDVYQLEQNLEDEVLLPDVGLGMAGEEVSACLRGMIERGMEGDYSHVVACFHPITLCRNDEAWRALESILAFCQSEGIPVRTLQDIAEFADARRNTRFEFHNQGKEILLVVSGPEDISKRGVTLLIAANGRGRVLHEGRELSKIRLDGRDYYWHVLAEIRASFSIPIRGAR